MAHEIAVKLFPGSGITDVGLISTSVTGTHADGFIGSHNPVLMGLDPTPVSGTTSYGFIGGHSPGIIVSGASLSQCMNPILTGAGLTRIVGSKWPGASTTSQSFGPKVSTLHNTTVVSTARQQGPASAGNMHQTGLAPGNSVQLPSPQRFSTVPGSFLPGMNGHPVRHVKPIFPTYLDDFKQGFPSKGLSTVSNRWWGNAEPDKAVEALSSMQNYSAGESETDVSWLDDSTPGFCRPVLSITPGKGTEVNQVMKSCRRVTRLRRMAAVGGKSALQLGVAKGYGMPKLGHKEVAILQFAFGDSIPRQWTAALPSRG